MNSVFANDDANAAPQGTTMDGNVLTNDADPEADTMTVTGATVNGTPLTIGTATTITGVGTITLNADGTYEFTPDADFVGTVVIPYSICDDGTPQACDEATLYLTSLGTTDAFCYRPATGGNGALPSVHGITALGRAGSATNQGNGVQVDNWPMVRNGAWTVLESKEKGFVVNRLSNVQVADIPEADLRIGMMVYNTDLDCLQINTTGTAAGWQCFNTQACPQ